RSDFANNRGSFERCNKERSRTNVRLPCVKGAGTANAVTEGLSLRKTYFSSVEAHLLNDARKVVGAQK
ncbi:MAG: hypothetical protein IIW31_00480, partial [Clostridia bacterium]|nr:hypothetical protein [Clostridia bacterium]